MLGGLLLLAPLPVPAEGLRNDTPLLPASGPGAVVSLRTLLDTVALGSTATYERLALQAGFAVQTFYLQRDFAPAWTHPDSGWNHSATRALALLRRAPAFGLHPETYAWPLLQSLPDSLQHASSVAGSLSGFELRLTDALLRYAAHLRYGRLQPFTTSPATLSEPAARQSIEQLTQALAAAEFETAFLACQPTGTSYQALQQAWRRTLPPDSVLMSSAQPAYGNAADFRRVALNLERLRWDIALPDSETYILVNIPSYSLHIIEKGRVVRTHRVVVGKPDTPTPVLSSRLTVFMTAPEWRVPHSIAVREILPELQDDPGFLADNKYRLFDARNRQVNPWRVRWSRVTPQTFGYTIRQEPGRHNALGNLVFYFANQHAIYLHDTPARALFREPHRARSHGCIRVEKPLELAAYLLEREHQQAALPDIRRNIATHTTCRYDLAQGLPIRIRYTTCEVQNSRLRFHPDIYCLDEDLATVLASP
ncbi:L,D-transpeptidase scaffold domain-containing protein [Hymenobacter yonginensis]|uniref:L,D-transpeptidase family protein n=1 Tax=Hymenobacter yonginensis TaxID=748197 RepID=A0ABY7PTA0_9BACT|nr:L,D-transpeptidase family protein [Hymenobacter yonginensis]WBO86058.1 L,D-transpeptidase family protein [Hymenobacter yonginensis]